MPAKHRAARDLNWKPVRDLPEEIHDGAPTLTGDRPFEYWGLEPPNKTNPDWDIRYASVFRIGGNNEGDPDSSDSHA